MSTQLRPPPIDNGVDQEPGVPVMGLVLLVVLTFAMSAVSAWAGYSVGYSSGQDAAQVLP